MPQGTLTIDLDAIVSNWKAMAALCAPKVQTSAVVKANSYGLGVTAVSRALFANGVRIFFVVTAAEGAEVRSALGPRAKIYNLVGFLPGEADITRANDLIPVLNSTDQATRFLMELPGHPCALQLDVGLNRLGLEMHDLMALIPLLSALSPELVIGHLGCADEVGHPNNASELAAFEQMTRYLPGIPRSLAATAGILLGPDYHFDMTRPGIGLYGSSLFPGALPAVTLSVPVVQIRDLTIGEAVGYGATWTATRPSRIATISTGYADGFHRAVGNKAFAYSGDVPCPIVGRISMDSITVDVTDLPDIPDQFELLNRHQTVDDLASLGATVPYEILTSLGPRFDRVYKGSDAK